MSGVSIECKCEICNAQFPSKTKLFKHLSFCHGWDDPKYDSLRYQRSVLLIGWIGKFAHDDENEETWLTDERKATTVHVDDTEKSIFAAIFAVENSLNSCDDVPPSAIEKYPKGYSRCGRSSQRSAFNFGVETSTHGLADLICLTLKRIDDNEQVEEWINKVNLLLPQAIRVHHRYAIPSEAIDFNAETSVSQRRYEIMLPLSSIMTEQFNLGASDDVIICPVAKKSHITESSMDYLFPRDTEEGSSRIEYFVAMKKVMKLFNTNLSSNDQPLSIGIKSFHNFVHGGITADESASRRRIDRFYHKQLMSFPDQGGVWVVFSISGDDFLLGQVRRIIATVVAIMKGFLPQSYLTSAFDPDNSIFLPIAPSWAVTFAEARYVTFETKYNFTLDPRRDPNGNTSRVDAWQIVIQKHIVSVGHDKINSWHQNLQRRCSELLMKWSLLCHLRSRHFQEFSLMTIRPLHSIITNSSIECQYAIVLQLLQEAYHSGLWPQSSTARQKLILNNGCFDDVHDTGGSFSVGCFPYPLLQPKGNTLFPELTLQCFRLERTICPHRPPSTTIAINRNAQFRPHRDSGIGKGQRTSLIVALGDFAGGELVVEDTPHDIRYQPLEFDGWAKRHSTLPFYGERFSLVWFSPEGVEETNMFWLNDPRFFQ